MKVLHVILGISKKSGGPSRSSQGLVAALCEAGVDAWIHSFDGAEPWVKGARGFRQGEILDLDAIKEFDAVHIHGVWNLQLHEVAKMCRAAKVPYVIAPRGMLEPWSLKQKWLKKRIARFLYQDHDLKKAAALHATAESEAEQFRKLGFKNYCIVSPNGVNLLEGKKARVGGISPDRRALRSELNAECGRRRALFVSRMHPKKGVLALVESWSRVKPQGWVCELVYTMNNDEEREYEQEVKDGILALGMSYQDKDGSIQSSTSTQDIDFLFTGPLDDDKKWEAYARAALFVLPTYSENFGIVIAEALWAGVPVITTRGTPWRDLVSHNCGWWIDLPAQDGLAKWDALDAALKEAASLDFPTPTQNSNSLKRMGENGHRLVEQKYTWKAVVDQMKHGYEQILNLREHAPCENCRNYGDTCVIK